MGKQTKTILVVDDDDDQRDILAENMNLLGYEVVTANDGQDALNRLEGRADFDLIITDIMMPEVDGFGLIEAIRNNTQFNHIPILVISAVGDNTSTAYCLALGADGILMKPFNHQLLKSTIVNFLGGEKK